MFHVEYGKILLTHKKWIMYKMLLIHFGVNDRDDFTTLIVRQK